MIRWLTILMVATGCARAGLVFGEMMKERHLAPDASSVEMDFGFRNVGEEVATIRQYDAACSCLSAQVKGGKLGYAPGEEGVVRVKFDMGNFSGLVDKKVIIWVDDDPQDEPSVVLTVRVHIPELVLIEPKTLRWEVGEEAGPKTMRVRMDYDKPITIIKLNGSSDRFRHELRTIREGAEYEVTVTPDETTTPGIGLLRIETDCPVARHQILQAFVVVQSRGEGPVAGQATAPSGQTARPARWLAVAVVAVVLAAVGGLWMLLRQRASAS